MTTAAQFGMATPIDSDYMKHGDDAITRNAEIAAALFSDLIGRVEGTPLPLDTDLNSRLKTGLHLIRNATLWASLKNRPAAAGDANAGFLRVAELPGSLVWQELTVYYPTPTRYWRISKSLSDLFPEWKDSNPAPSPSAGTITGGNAGLANQLRVQAFTARRGGTKYTAGRGAVALRFDHGLGNFRDVVLPLLRKHSLPFALALNPRNWDRAENGGVTAADVRSWVANDRAEVWNHGATHGNATTAADLRDEIATGLAELQEQISNTVIDGFMVPGVGTPGYDNFNAGTKPEAFYDTMAGRLILENHAVSSGYYPGTARRVLDGTIRQGQNHYTMDARTLADVRAEIAAAERDATGLQLMLHPSLIGGDGYISATVLGQVLAYIAAERDAGRLVVLSPYDLLLADSTPTPPLDTGRRVITSLLSPDYSAVTVTLRRSVNTVTLIVNNLSKVRADASGNVNLFTLPVGFRPDGHLYGQTFRAMRCAYLVNGSVYVTDPSASVDYFYFTFTTSDPWPAALPGVAG